MKIAICNHTGLFLTEICLINPSSLLEMGNVPVCLSFEVQLCGLYGVLSSVIAV